MKSNINNLIYSILGVIFNMLFPLITYPYITRTLGVVNLGEYNFYTSTVAYLALISGFGISLHGTKEIGRYSNDKSKYSQVFGELLSINVIMVVVVYLIVLALMLWGENYHNTKLFFISSITILTECIGAEFIFVALEKQRFMLIRNVIFKIISLTCIFIFVRTDTDLIPYAIIMLVSTAGISVTNIVSYQKYIKWNSISIKPQYICLHLAPLLQVFLMNLLINYYGKMDIVVLGNIDSLESVGYYSTASKIYALAYTLLASTAIPLLPRVSFYIEQGLTNVYEILIQRCYDIYLLSTNFIGFALFVYSDEIIVLIAGDTFALAGLPLKFFAVALIFSSLCNCFIFQIFYPHNKAKLVLSAQVVGIGVNIILNIILVPFLSYIGAAIAFLVSYIIMFIWMCVIGRNIIPRFSGVYDALKEVASIVICSFVVWGLSFTSLYFLIQICLCGCVYLISCYVLKNKTFLYIAEIIMKRIKHNGYD